MYFKVRIRKWIARSDAAPTPTSTSTGMDRTRSTATAMAEVAAAEEELRRGFETLEVVQKDPSIPVFHIYLNRPAQRNALTLRFFSDLPRALSLLSLLPSARSIVLASRGSHFCAGIDLSVLQSAPSSPSADPAAAADLLRRQIVSLQAAVSALERCRKPVIAAIHGACVGGGVDLVAACDIRCCSGDAFFAVKEVDLALAADLGSLQRLPAIVGYGNASDLALTGRRIDAGEAKAMGLVSRVFSSPAALEEAVDLIARELAAKSAVAVMGTKAVMLRSRDQTVEDGLDYVATWNSAMLMSRDLQEAVAAQMQKRKPNFSKL
ncbi:1,4-Dihydroxy-2-naphthoyl-CoA synthase, peroxisomal [Apostasia shenzhenica]|uniref:1,4-Dihydroxy-2-naphthoyl-CoA synthase, peroxisomal n=1 Tax=Apostasia shenzhenica TaxID=1088818 RepID=A0A2I0AIB1_9ASPA|nr:1,4-Dihydroxy-2-naphthoyl-CoA synthase, peroxisomal [Apostasia shenzhenica]